MVGDKHAPKRAASLSAASSPDTQFELYAKPAVDEEFAARRSLSEAPPNFDSEEREESLDRIDTQDPGPPPDSSLTGWLQVFYGHMIVFQTWGYASSFGLFQTYYEDVWKIEESTISWIGTIQVFLLLFMGTFAGRAADAGHLKLVLATGCSLQILGVMMSSLCQTYCKKS